MATFASDIWHEKDEPVEANFVRCGVSFEAPFASCYAKDVPEMFQVLIDDPPGCPGRESASNGYDRVSAVEQCFFRLIDVEQDARELTV